MKNENRELIIALTFIGLMVVQRPIELTFKAVFMRVIPQTKFPRGSDLRESKAKMLGERIFKITINLLCVGLLYRIMLGDDCNFLDVRLGGHTEHPLYFYNHPC